MPKSHVAVHYKPSTQSFLLADPVGPELVLRALPLHLFRRKREPREPRGIRSSPKAKDFKPRVSSPLRYVIFSVAEGQVQVSHPCRRVVSPLESRMSLHSLS